MRKRKDTYKMREKLISIIDDYWIEDETGERAFFINGKALRIRNTLILKICGETTFIKLRKNYSGSGIRRISRKQMTAWLLQLKSLTNILRDKWRVEIPDGSDMEIRSDVLDHVYEIESEGRKIAEISKSGSASETLMEWRSSPGRTMRLS